jgi:hypothetical protein
MMEMNFHRLLPLASYALLLTFAVAGADNSFHGIRNAKCGKDENEARTLVFEKLSSDPKLCEEGTFANQSGGWSCRSGGECPKGKYRCNTQYVCGKSQSSEAEQPTLTLTMPDHATPKVPGEKPHVQAVVPEARPNAVTPKGAEGSPSVANSKREIKDGGSAYVEETTTDDKGNKTTIVRPKSAKDTDIKPTSLPSSMPSAAPSAAPKSEMNTAADVARKLVNPAQKAMDEKTKALDSLE